MSFKEHEIKRAKELRAKFGDLATEVCNEMLDDRYWLYFIVVGNIGSYRWGDLRKKWRTYWGNIKSILNQNKDDEDR